MNNFPMLYAIDNRGMPNLDHFFGAPFIAKDFDSACEMVKEALAKDKDLLNLSDFYLIELVPYDCTSPFPFDFENTDEVPEEICVADLFEDEEKPADEVAYCGRYEGIIYKPEVENE